MLLPRKAEAILAEPCNLLALVFQPKGFRGNNPSSEFNSRCNIHLIAFGWDSNWLLCLDHCLTYGDLSEGLEAFLFPLP